ncbi:hypothetical protein ASZ90_014989 [hydrocarbon metagenome]|uniref:Uncharacterized protein n=1 Tax=hydrocarbon metagenome TaxID=938273 RepID=A0A0W8F363_9ZZZZ
MNHPASHSFSRSPVEEVFCCCTSGSDAEPRSLTIPPPYPGWPPIRDRIRDMIAGAGEVSRINGCMIRYIDLIPVADEKILPGIEVIERLLSGRFRCSLDNTQNDVVLIRTKIPNTEGSVCSIRNRPGNLGWTLIFSMKTGDPARFVSVDSVVSWFDDARAGIHEIFDCIVPEEIVQSLR